MTARAASPTFVRPDSPVMLSAHAVVYATVKDAARGWARVTGSKASACIREIARQAWSYEGRDNVSVVASSRLPPDGQTDPIAVHRVRLNLAVTEGPLVVYVTVIVVQRGVVETTMLVDSLHRRLYPQHERDAVAVAVKLAERGARLLAAAA